MARSSKTIRHYCKPVLALIAGLACATFMLPASGAPLPSNPYLEVDPSQIIVKFKPSAVSAQPGVGPKSAGASGSAAAALGQLRQRTRTRAGKVLHGRLRLQAVELEPGADIEGAIREYEKSGLVEYAEPNYVIALDYAPNDPKFSQLWGLHNSGQNGGMVDADINAPEAWDVRRSAGGLIVAVIDTGIRYTHEDLASVMWRNPGEIPGNKIDDDANGVIDDIHGINAISGTPLNKAGDPMDDHDHGSHCAGTIAAAQNNGKGVAGVADGVQLMACKFIASNGRGATSDAIVCLDYARRMGAKVISCSWGGGAYSRALLDAIRAAGDEGIVIVAAAGNDHENTDVYPHYPSSYPADNLISVGAIDRTGARAEFSNYGAGSVQVFAPGSDILSCGSTTNTEYRSMNGTSMATPHVAGVVALMRAHFPGDTPSMTIHRVMNSVKPAAVASLAGGYVDLAAAYECTDATPFNDPFTYAADLGKINGASFRVVNRLATSEPGEPLHASQPGDSSVWYKWLPTRNGKAILSTRESTFDTLLAVYTGTSVNSLTKIAANDNASASTTESSLTFSARLNTVYYIAVAGKNGASGACTLSVAIPPGNDNFSKAKVLGAAQTYPVSGDNFGATAEPGEPNHGSEGASTSVWYAWTAPENGTYKFTTKGSDFDTTLAVYTGTAVDALSLVGSNDDVIYGWEVQSSVTIDATAGTTYRIAVAGWRGDQGKIKLNLLVPPSDPSAMPQLVEVFRTVKHKGSTAESSFQHFTIAFPLGDPNPLPGIESRFYGASDPYTIRFDRPVQSASCRVLQGLGDFSASNLKIVCDGTSDVRILNIGGNAATVQFVVDELNGTSAETQPFWIAKYCGDVNADGKLDQADLDLVTAQQGSGAPTPANFRCDVNNDNVIDADDVLEVKRQKNTTAYPEIPLPPRVTGVQSRLPHGASGGYGLELDGEASNVEPRSGGPGGTYELDITFSEPVVLGPEAITVSRGTATIVGTPLLDGDKVTVRLSGVANRQIVELGLPRIEGSEGYYSGIVPFRVLLGDVNRDGIVNIVDVNAARRAAASPWSAASWPADADGNGVVNSADINMVRAESGNAVP